MGCLFTCLRVRDNRHLSNSTNVTSRSNDVAVSKNRLSTLFISEEKENSAHNDGKNYDEGFPGDERELKNEAKFLKACGTLASTPDKIWKASEKLQLSPCGKASDSSRFPSCLLNTSAEKVQINVQPFNPPTPTKQCEEWEKGMDSCNSTPSSCITNAQYTQWDSRESTEGSRISRLHPSDRAVKSTDSVSPLPSVRFECDTNMYSCELSSGYGGWHMKKTESPNPTLMKLSDEKQTPVTVYPSTLKVPPNGKPQFKSQFMYPNSSVGEDTSQSKILEEVDYVPEQDSMQLSNSIEQSQNATSMPEKGLKKMSCENESNVEESLSSWLKPASVILEERSKRMENGIVRKNLADRPIIGLVAAHWNEDEDFNAPLPKWWDGNGIPNSTNKYKEDQKVSWHATPFEERLERALSEDTVISQRKDIYTKPITFDVKEESDTALSQLKSSTHPQSVVSF